MHLRLFLLIACTTTIALLAGCNPNREGRAPGSCADGIDNDGNLAIDCVDPGCADAPACGDHTDPTEDPTPTPEPTPIPTPTPQVFDCSTISNSPISERTIAGPRGYHGLAFDDSGNIVGNTDDDMLKSDYSGNWNVFVPGVGQKEQMDYLPNGDLVAADSWSGGLTRITPAGGTSTFATSVNAYGVVVGPDGMVYTAGSGGIYRVNPANGQRTSMGSLNSDEAHSLDFSPDYSRLYIGTIADGWSGVIYKIDLNASMDPVGGPQVFANNIGEGWHDGVAVDACGYLYVPDFWSSTLNRISPNGQSIVYVNWSANSSMYGHGAEFGNGIGGWRDDAIYLPMPYNNNMVKEIVVGVPSRYWKGQVINAP